MHCEGIRGSRRAACVFTSQHTPPRPALWWCVCVHGREQSKRRHRTAVSGSLPLLLHESNERQRPQHDGRHTEHGPTRGLVAELVAVHLHTRLHIQENVAVLLNFGQIVGLRSAHAGFRHSAWICLTNHTTSGPLETSECMTHMSGGTGRRPGVKDLSAASALGWLRRTSETQRQANHPHRVTIDRAQ